MIMDVLAKMEKMPERRAETILAHGGLPDLREKRARTFVKKVEKEFLELPPEKYQYGGTAGPSVAREAISEYLQNLGANIKSEDIVLCAGGAQNALAAFAHDAERKKKKVLTTDPFYTGISALTDKLVLVNLNKKFQIDENEVEKCLKRGGVEYFYIISPGNPDGTVKKNIKELVELGERYEVKVIIDAAYTGIFEGAGDPYSEYVELLNTAENFAIIGTLSKSGWMPGARTGIVITRSRELKDVFTSYFSSHTLFPGTGAYYAYILFREGGKLIREGAALQREISLYRLKKLHRAVSEKVKEAVGEKYVKLPPKETLGGFFLWLGFPGVRREILVKRLKKDEEFLKNYRELMGSEPAFWDKSTSELISHALLNKKFGKYVAVAPGSGFSRRPEPYIRIAACYLNDREIEEVAEALASFLTYATN